ncbi:MAG: hypothetical protein ACI8WB_004189 [Phenylobacterium sp.]|jgi:hypothetical protein
MDQQELEQLQSKYKQKESDALGYQIIPDC